MVRRFSHRNGRVVAPRRIELGVFQHLDETIFVGAYRELEHPLDWITLYYVDIKTTHLSTAEAASMLRDIVAETFIPNCEINGHRAWRDISFYRIIGVIGRNGFVDRVRRP